MSIFTQECLETDLLVRRRELNCYGIRGCDAVIDVAALEVIFWQAAQAVRIMKRGLAALRRNRNTTNAVDSIEGGDIRIYRKSYDLHLLAA